MNHPIKALAVLLVCAGMGWWVWLCSAETHQARAADLHRVAVARALARYPEFRRVQPQADADGQTSTLVIAGHVATEQDLQRLRSVVAATKPPVPVHYAVAVGDGERPAER